MVHQVADPGDGGGWVYDARPHPDLTNSGSARWYVTYSRVTGPFTRVLVLAEVDLE